MAIRGHWRLNLNPIKHRRLFAEYLLLVMPCRQEASSETMRTGCPRTQATRMES